MHVWRRIKWVWVLLGLTILGNIALLIVAKQLYTADNALRLDPLQLALYPDSNLPKTKPRVVFFGDSRALSWPAPNLERFEFINRGIGQQTSSQIQLRFNQHIKPLQADWLLLQLGVNDLKAIPLLPVQRDAIVARCKQNITSIIAQAHASGSNVIITTIFPVGKVPPERWLFWSDAVAQAIDEVNAFIMALNAPEQGVVVLDTYAVLQGERQRIRPEYSRDLLHLNAAGYERLNQTLLEVLTALPAQSSQ